MDKEKQLTKEYKLDLCRKCEYCIKDETESTFDGYLNDEYCKILDSLIRPYLMSNCPKQRW